jgi:lactate dehydrogenase-like 2-hydroxyacid dehydrogenase
LKKPEILVITPVYAPTLAVLEREFVVHKLWEASDADAYIKTVSANVRGVVTTGLVGCGRRYIEALPQLEIIACFGEGDDTLDLAAAQEHGVVVTNTRNSIIETVADLALGLLLATMRRIAACDRFVRAGKWQAGPPVLGSGLTGKTCGIVGLGKIGASLARRVAACGMSVCYHGPREKAGAGYPYFADLEAMARAADCLVVSCPNTPATHKMIDARILNALGADGFLVNVARGAIVDEQALIAALRDDRIAGAGLDVFWDEPQVPAELKAMENVVLVPHIGSYTREIRDERSAMLLASVRAHFAGKPVLTRLV